jgi:hypothetical protein
MVGNAAASVHGSPASAGETERRSDPGCSASSVADPGDGVMARSIAAGAVIAAVIVGLGMAAPAFAKHGNGNNGGWNANSNPPGWSHGNKTGWGGRGMPPGLYKKYSRSNRGYPNSYSGSSGYYRDYWNYYGAPWSYYGY